MDHDSLRRVVPRRAGHPALRSADVKANRSMPDMVSAPMTDDDDDDADSLLGRAHNSSVPPVSPLSAIVPACAPPRRLRRVASSPDGVRLDSAWRVVVATDTFADDSTILPEPMPDIDPSMLLMRGLDSSVSDAQSLQRWKTRNAMPSGGKRKRTRETVVSCRRCGVEDTPKWRPGPDGRRTLCNVCGLLFARRERRKYINGEDGWG